jgi:hypothetical protein
MVAGPDTNVCSHAVAPASTRRSRRRWRGNRGATDVVSNAATRRSTGGVEQDVDLVETGEVDDDVDAAYRAKYERRYASIVPSIVTPGARDATLKLVPR